MAVVNSRLADLSDDDRQVLDSWVVEFDQGWDEGLLANRLQQVPPGSSWRLLALAEMVKIDLQRQWERGRQVSLESYLAEFPELGSPGDVSADLIQAEYEVRRQFGAPASLEDYLRRFPHQAGDLARLIALGGSALSRPPSAVAVSRSSARGQKSAKAPEPLPEQFGRYRIIRRLGQGGMGSVYLAQDTHLERPVALKVPDFGSHEDTEARRRFLEEARTAATLDHPYLCPVYDAGEIDGQLYLTMAYIEGQSLASLIGDAGWPQRQVAALVGKLALAMQEAHTKKVVHRDLKPANVMIKSSGQRREPVIVDFGLARRDNPQEQRLTKSGQVMGTLGYMAPEQIRGDLKEIGPGCDIYALGVILYELLTGRLPFTGSGLAIAGEILTKVALPPSTHRSDLDPELEAICLKAMAKELGDRYSSMAELAAALTGWLQAPSARRTTPGPSGSPESSLPATSERPQPAGSNTLVGQFLAELAVPQALPSPLSIAEPPVSRSPLPRPRRSVWPMIVAAGVLGGGVLFLAINAATDRPRTTNSTGDTGILLNSSDDGLARPAVSRPTVPDVAGNNGRIKNAERASRVQDGPRVETEISATTSPLAEPSPWPGALALAGQVLPVRDRFLAMSGDCRRLAVATERDFQIVTAPDSAKVFEMKGQLPAHGGNAGYVWSIAFSPDGKYVATSLHDLQVRIWETASGKEVCRTSLFPGTALAYSPDGKRLAVSGRQTKVVSVGDAATGKKLIELGPHSAVTDCVAYSPDGKRLASGSGADPGDDWGLKFGTGSDLKIWDPETRTGFALEGHPMRVSAVAFSPDGKRLASASSDRTVKVWDLATKKCLVTFDEHQGPVRFVRFSPDGRLIASAGEDKLVRLWDAATGREVASFAGLPSKPEFLQFSPGGHWIYSGATSTLKAWATPPSPEAAGTSGSSTVADNPPEKTQEIKPPGPQLDIEAASVEFKTLFNGIDLKGWKLDPKQAGLWRVEDGKLVGSGPSISHLYTKRGNFSDFHLRLEARFNEGGTGGVFLRCPFGASLPADDPKWPDGYEATINNARIVRNSTGGLYPNRGNAVFITDFTTVPFGEWFTLEVIAEGNAFAVLVNGKLRGYHSDPNIRSASGHIALQQYTPETKIEFRKIEIKELNRSNKKDPKEITLLRHPVRVSRVSIMPDGLGILSGGIFIEHARTSIHPDVYFGNPYAVWLREAASGKNRFTMRGEGAAVAALALSSDGRYLASAPGLISKIPVLIWDLKSGQRIHKLSEKPATNKPGCLALSFSPDDHLVMAASMSGTVVVWDVETEQEQPPIVLKAGPINQDEFPVATFCSDRRHLVTGSRTGPVELWDLQTCQRVRRFGGHNGEVRGVGCSADGRLILSGGSDNTVRLWDVATGSELKRLSSDDRQVKSVAFSPDSHRALTAGLDGPVRLWDLASGKEVCRMEGHTMGVNSVAFSPDGKQAISGSDDKTVRLWRLPESNVTGGKPIKVAQTPSRGSVVKARALPSKAETTPSVNPAPPQPADVPKPKPTIPSEPQRPITNPMGMKLVLIPCGEFVMGSPDSDPDAETDEKPPHRVRITRPFYLGAHEVTRRQYRAVTGADPSSFKDSDDLPVDQVSWNDAIAFCNKLSEMEKVKPCYEIGGALRLGGDGYRLPTEAEWEYACRAGSTTKYSCGDEAARLGGYVWYHGNSERRTHVVGKKRPNAWGLYDMHGNVFEWCGDWYAEDYYRASPAVDPTGPSKAEERVVRGGGWGSLAAQSCRSASRLKDAPAKGYFNRGFRIARTLPGP